MADITAEQVARAIEAARADEGGISDALGGWAWDKRAPDYVRVAWGKSSLPDFIAALTRWHAELAAAEGYKVEMAAEPVRRVARWDPKSGRYILTPRRILPMFPDCIASTHSRADCIAWGYEIEGGPEPQPAEDSPERLRERREALGWHRARAADGMPLLWHDIECLETGRTDEDAADRARYAAALSAAEAERPAKPDPLAYADSPAWDDWPMPKPVPALEMVDVPQPVVKRMGDHTAAWERGESEVSIATKMAAGPDRVMGYPLALLRAMLEAIDAQQGGA